VPYKSNPLDYRLWLAYTNTGYDLIVFNKRIELKYNSPDTVVYKSYLDRDWLSRTNVIVVNDNNPVLKSKRLLRYLKNKGKRVLSLSEFIKWVKIKLRHRVTSNNKNNYYLNRTMRVIKSIRIESYNVSRKISLLLGNLNKPPPEQAKRNVAFLSSDHSSEDQYKNGARAKIIPNSGH